MKKRIHTKNQFARTLTLFATAALLTTGTLTSCTQPELAAGISTSFDNNAQTTPPVNTPTPTNPELTTSFADDIKDIAAKSACAQISWTDRGRAPLAYMKGMALTYARSLCRIRANPTAPAAPILKAVSSGNASKDVLSHYSTILSNADISTDEAGDEPLHATFVIGMGLGMRESSGRYCVGWDVAAGADRTSAEAEAGLFQQSYDSISASTELRKIYEEYKNDESRCHLATFKQGVSCSPQSILGTGAGADYQSFIKRCPAFAAEYAMTLIRLQRSHFGPLNRQTAQVVPECDSMLNQVQRLVESDPESACAELF
jgi:hypothetical protein